MLAFRTLVHGAAPGGMEARPSFHLVRTEAQRAALAARLSAIDRPTLAVVDLATSVVIATFQGLQPSSGYRIDILAVEASGNVLEVTVKRSAPAPGELVRQGFESPYQLVQVAREAFDIHHFVSYRLRDVGSEVLQEGPIDTLGLNPGEPGLVKGNQPCRVGPQNLTAQAQIPRILPRALGHRPRFSQLGVRQGLFSQAEGPFVLSCVQG